MQWLGVSENLRSPLENKGGFAVLLLIVSINRSHQIFNNAYFYDCLETDDLTNYERYWALQNQTMASVAL